MKKILVIDDEAPMRVTVTRMLRKQGYDTLEADCAEVGLELVSAQMPDLVLSDVHMTGVDGFEFLKRLRSNTTTAALPVILMTGAAETADLRSSMDLGADDYLPKPFDAQTLARAVGMRLERQRTIQAEARAHETKLLDILSATQDLVAIAEADNGRLTYLNAAGRAMLGVGPSEDISGTYLTDFYVEEDSSVSYAERIQCARREGIWVGEGFFLRRDGRRVPVSKQVLVHREEEGQGAYLSIVARDITELKRAEQERQRMEVQLRQAQKLEAIGQLAAGIAHEINTPAQYVGDNTRFLQDSFRSLEQVVRVSQEVLAAANADGLTPELRGRASDVLAKSDLVYLFDQVPAAINETLEGIGRITRIVRAMKEFSHPGGKEMSPADLNKAIETTVTVARNEWKYVADLKLDLEPDLPMVPCFLGEFNQAILNLVINAAHAISDVVKAHPGTKGALSVQTRRIGTQVEIRVSDTGTGIPKTYRSRIFEPFFTTKEVGKGTGQGLSIVYNSIVKKHGGTVTFETEEGKGTTFIIHLPSSGAASSAAHAEDSPPNQPSTS